MDIKTFASEVKETVKFIKEKQGIEAIKCENLIAYLDDVIKSPGELSLAHLEKYKAELQVWVEQNKTQQYLAIENFRSVIIMGQNALKSAFLMNGGATVALLAFLGKLSDQHQDKIPIFSNSLLIFVFGVLVIVMASGLTYLSQNLYSHPKYQNHGIRLNVFVVFLGFASYILFIWGALVAYKAFMAFA